MPLANIVLSGAAIVLRGSFNPAIFQPAWFAAQGLLPEAEMKPDSVRLGIIHPDLSQFETERLQLQVTKELFQVTSTTSPFPEILRDLTLGTFRILSHTPIKMMGINKWVHVRTESVDVWNGVGHKLAPKEFWQEVLRNPGTQSLTIRGQRPDNYAGWIDVKVEPSPSITLGVYVQVNDHYQLNDPEAGANVADIMAILEADWGNSEKRSAAIIDHMDKLL